MEQEKVPWNIRMVVVVLLALHGLLAAFLVEAGQPWLVTTSAVAALYVFFGGMIGLATGAGPAPWRVILFWLPACCSVRWRDRLIK